MKKEQKRTKWMKDDTWTGKKIKKRNKREQLELKKKSGKKIKKRNKREHEYKDK